MAGGQRRNELARAHTPLSMLARVRTSCAEVAAHARHVRVRHCGARWARVTPPQVDLDGIGRFVDQLDVADWQATMRLCADPAPDVAFDTPEAEMDFYSIVGILNFGSGYRLELMAANNGRGASDSIVHGTKALHHHLKGRLAAAELIKLDLATVARLYCMEVAPLLPLATKIHAALTDSARILLTHHHASFHDFVSAHLSSSANAETLVTALVETFPVMRDVHIHRGREVWVLKKPQLMAIDLHRHLHRRLPHLFAWPDKERLTVFADNVLPVILRHFGVLVLDASLAALIDGRGVLPADEREVELRALSVHACTLLLARLNARLAASGVPLVDSTQLDFFLWWRGRDVSRGASGRH